MSITLQSCWKLTFWAFVCQANFENSRKERHHAVVLAGLCVSSSGPLDCSRLPSWCAHTPSAGSCLCILQSLLVAILKQYDDVLTLARWIFRQQALITWCHYQNHQKQWSKLTLVQLDAESNHNALCLQDERSRCGIRTTHMRSPPHSQRCNIDSIKCYSGLKRVTDLNFLAEKCLSIVSAIILVSTNFRTIRKHNSPCFSSFGVPSSILRSVKVGATACEPKLGLPLQNRRGKDRCEQNTSCSCQAQGRGVFQKKYSSGRLKEKRESPLITQHSKTAFECSGSESACGRGRYRGRWE